MSFDPSIFRDPADEPFGQVRPFPADRIVRAQPRLACPRAGQGPDPGDQVTVTHLGRTVAYPDPPALHAEVLKQYAPEIAQARDAAVAAALADQYARHDEALRHARLTRRADDLLTGGLYGALLMLLAVLALLAGVGGL